MNGAIQQMLWHMECLPKKMFGTKKRATCECGEGSVHGRSELFVGERGASHDEGREAVGVYGHVRVAHAGVFLADAPCRHHGQENARPLGYSDVPPLPSQLYEEGGFLAICHEHWARLLRQKAIAICSHSFSPIAGGKRSR